jgi:diguanylate cyclase (GGDEF)-like protein
VTETILVADNEAEILRFVEINLQLEGYDVVTATDGEEALRAALRIQPALVVLDVMMPVMDGNEVCRRLRADSRTCSIPIIILTARSLTADKVVGLTSGADDYVLKPFDPIELAARVRSTLLRSAELRASSPLTGLPGNHRIDAELARRLAESIPTAAVYADINDFKSYNDRYGFLRGDAVILLTAEVLREALDAHASPGWFLGHIGGDDFVFACDPASVDAVCAAVVASFDERIAAAYDPQDAAEGALVLLDRRGELQRFPLASISLGVASTERRSFADHRELLDVATEMKRFLKQQAAGSAFALDSRVDEPASV